MRRLQALACVLAASTAGWFAHSWWNPNRNARVDVTGVTCHVSQGRWIKTYTLHNPTRQVETVFLDERTAIDAPSWGPVPITLVGSPTTAPGGVPLDAVRYDEPGVLLGEVAPGANLRAVVRLNPNDLGPGGAFTVADLRIDAQGGNGDSGLSAVQHYGEDSTCPSLG